MSLISLVIVLAVVGVLLWLLNTKVPMEPWVKQVINIVVIFAVVLWLMNAFGLLSGINDIRIGPVR